MFRNHAAAALVLASLVTLPVAAQLHGSGGEVTFVKKGSQPFSGSLGASLLNGNAGYEATLGGTLIQDRLWFFASGSRQDFAETARLGSFAMPEQAVSSAIGGKVSGRIGDASDFSAYMQSQRTSFDGVAVSQQQLIPSSFLSLRYTAVISPSMTFNVSASRSKTRPSVIGFEPVE